MFRRFLHLLLGGAEMPTELSEFSNALADATARAAASIVAGHTETHGSSSGIIWRPGGVGTSEHALRRDEENRVTPPDGRVPAATPAGGAPPTRPPPAGLLGGEAAPC